MFGMPGTTEFDIRFRLLGIPVRIHPLFWATAALLGWSGTGLEIVIWVACVFVSILVHEFGHGLTARALSGVQPSIVLYLMGGLCFSDEDRRHLGRRAAVLIMGPMAGFLLMGLTIVVGTLVTGVLIYPTFDPDASLFLHLHPETLRRPPAWMLAGDGRIGIPILHAYHDLVRINLLWGLFNLLPIYPLDGGQLTQVALSAHDRNHGARRSYIVGLVVAGLLAIYAFTNRDFFRALFLASLAMLNYQSLQIEHQRVRYDDWGDSGDWWKR